MTTTTRRESGKLDAILILKQMHEDVKGQFEELLHTYYPFQAQEPLAAAAACSQSPRADRGDVRLRATSTGFGRGAGGVRQAA